MKGEVWNYFLLELEKIKQNKLFDPNSADLHLLSQPGGEDKFFAKKLMKEIQANFFGNKEEYKNFLDENGIKDEKFHQVEENRKL